MNPRFLGFGRFLAVIPVLTYVPLRFIVGDFEEAHRSAVLSLCLAVSAVITFVIAAAQDKKSGMDLFSSPAWTSALMESQHVFFYLPIRVVAVLMALASVAVLFL